MAAKIWSSAQGAFVDAPTPQIYDSSTGAYKDSTGLTHDAESGAWSECWNATFELTDRFAVFNSNNWTKEMTGDSFLSFGSAGLTLQRNSTDTSIASYARLISKRTITGAEKRIEISYDIAHSSGTYSSEVYIIIGGILFDFDTTYATHRTGCNTFQYDANHNIVIRAAYGAIGARTIRHLIDVKLATDEIYYNNNKVATITLSPTFEQAVGKPLITFAEYMWHQGTLVVRSCRAKIEY